MSKRKIGCSLLILFLVVGLSIFITRKEENMVTTVFSSFQERMSVGRKKLALKEDTAIGSLLIPKIHLQKKLYAVEDKRNTISQNVTILKESNYPDQEGSTLYLAAHSGNAKNSYFEKLDQLTIGDFVEIHFKKNVYTYQIDQIESQVKTGKITVPISAKKQLILTTCHPKEKDKQLVLVAYIQKETDS